VGSQTPSCEFIVNSRALWGGPRPEKTRCGADRERASDRAMSGMRLGRQLSGGKGIELLLPVVPVGY